MLSALLHNTYEIAIAYSKQSSEPPLARLQGVQGPSCNKRTNASADAKKGHQAFGLHE